LASLHELGRGTMDGSGGNCGRVMGISRGIISSHLYLHGALRSPEHPIKWMQNSFLGLFQIRICKQNGMWQSWVLWQYEDLTSV
jgi:hypothetical protein